MIMFNVNVGDLMLDKLRLKYYGFLMCVGRIAGLVFKKRRALPKSQQSYFNAINSFSTNASATTSKNRKWACFPLEVMTISQLL